MPKEYQLSGAIRSNLGPLAVSHRHRGFFYSQGGKVYEQSTGVNMASIGVKLASVSRSGKPADYDLDETCAIIEKGLGKNAASLFRESARRQPGHMAEARHTPDRGMGAR